MWESFYAGVTLAPPSTAARGGAPPPHHYTSANAHTTRPQHQQQQQQQQQQYLTPTFFTHNRQQQQQQQQQEQYQPQPSYPKQQQYSPPSVQQYRPWSPPNVMLSAQQASSGDASTGTRSRAHTTETDRTGSTGVTGHPNLPKKSFSKYRATKLASVSVTFFEATFPPDTALGVALDEAKLAYTVGDSINIRSIPVCAVGTGAAAGRSDCVVQAGDVVVSVNGTPTINVRGADGALLRPRMVATQVLTGLTGAARVLRLMRFKDPSVLQTNTVVHFSSSDVLGEIFDDGGYDPLGYGRRPGGGRLLKIDTNAASSSFAAYLAISFGDQERLGLSLEPQRLVYVKEETGERNVFDCVVVTASDITEHLRAGDVVVKVNGEPLNSPATRVTANRAEQEAFFKDVVRMLTTATRPRAVVVLRILTVDGSTAAGNNGVRNGSIADSRPTLILSADDEETIFAPDVRVAASSRYATHAHGDGPSSCDVDFGHSPVRTHTASSSSSSSSSGNPAARYDLPTEPSPSDHSPSYSPVRSPFVDTAASFGYDTAYSAKKVDLAYVNVNQHHAALTGATRDRADKPTKEALEEEYRRTQAAAAARRDAAGLLREQLERPALLPLVPITAETALKARQDEAERAARIEAAVTARLSSHIIHGGTGDAATGGDGDAEDADEERGRRKGLEESIRERVDREARALLSHARDAARAARAARGDNPPAEVYGAGRGTSPRPSSRSARNDSNASSVTATPEGTPKPGPHKRYPSPSPLRPFALTPAPALAPGVPTDPARVFYHTVTEAGPLGLRLETVTLTYATARGAAVTVYAVEVTASTLEHVRPGDILLGTNHGPPLLAPLTEPPQIHLQNVAGTVARARPLVMTYFRCPRLAAHATARTAQERAAAVTLSVDESAVFAGEVTKASSSAALAAGAVGAVDVVSDEPERYSTTNGMPGKVFSTDNHNHSHSHSHSRHHGAHASGSTSHGSGKGASSGVVETGELFEIEYPAGSAVGLLLDAIEVTYIDGGRPHVVHCCAVRQSRVVQVRPGDVLVSVNGASLVGQASQGATGGPAHTTAVSEAIHRHTGARVLRFFRAPAIGADDSRVHLGLGDAMMLLED